jgi:uncharacterized protein YoxC
MMTHLAGEFGAWMLQAAAGAAQTAVPVTVVAQERGLFEQVTGIASGLMSIALLALAVALIPAAWSFRRSYQKASRLMDRIHGDITPLMRHASSIADNVDYVTTTIRGDVQRINATVALANQRITQAVELTEERLNEFNALMQVVQEEAESLFVSTASTVRGVRSGAAAFRAPRGTDLASVEADGAPGADVDHMEYDLEHQEELDGTDSLCDPGDPPSSPGPRVRPRARRRR